MKSDFNRVKVRFFVHPDQQKKSALMANMDSPEANLFELARTCDSVDRLRSSLDSYELGKTTLDENHNELPVTGGDQGVDVSRLRDEDGRSILHHCVANRRSQNCFEYLLRRYPQLLLAADYQGLTLMHLAVINGNVSLLRFLCGSGRKSISPNNFRLLLNAPDNELHSCLHWAVVCLEDSCLQLLLQAAAEQKSVAMGNDTEPNVLAVRDVHGATPLHYAAQAGSRRMRTVSAGSNEAPFFGPDDARASLDSSSQDVPVASGSQDITKRLALRILKRILQSGQVPIDCRDNEGRTPLLWAASSGKHPPPHLKQPFTCDCL
jgi:ankyrin repeat protein